MVQELYLDTKHELLRAENDVIMAHIHDEKCLNSNKAWTGFDKKEYKFGDRYQNHRKETPFKSLHGQREIHKRCEKDFHKREILQSTRNDLF